VVTALHLPGAFGIAAPWFCAERRKNQFLSSRLAALSLSRQRDPIATAF